MTLARRLPRSPSWTRRAWLTATATQTGALVALAPWSSRSHASGSGWGSVVARHAQRARAAAHAVCLEPGPPQALARQAVEAARTAGAQYADARLTRTVQHTYGFGDGILEYDGEYIGMGVRALVDGYWGYTSRPLWGATPDGLNTVVRLARDAVAQARTNTKGPPRTVEMGHVPAATGTWATPVAIDPFGISIEEKCDAIRFWEAYAERQNLRIDEMQSKLRFARQERVLATSDDVYVTQTLYASGGVIIVHKDTDNSSTYNTKPPVLVERIEMAGRGWELFLDAHIPEQLDAMLGKLDAQAKQAKEAEPSVVGRYTLVCDGATMASLVEQTLGIATQLDRALGYEANAGGTSFIDDPLAMVGHVQVASPMVTITANRSAPTQLATVRWDDEGIAPEPFTLVKDGVLMDFQTTREQAAWLAPYYTQQRQPVRSNGCAAAEDASYITMQHMPNLALVPSTAAVRIEDLIGDVKQGRLITNGSVAQIDVQARNGLLVGTMQKIENGRMGRTLTGGAVLFSTMDLWKHVMAIGGIPSEMGMSEFNGKWDWWKLVLPDVNTGQGIFTTKGQPPQMTSHTVRAVAATITNQPFINATRRA